MIQKGRLPIRHAGASSIYQLAISAAATAALPAPWSRHHSMDSSRPGGHGSSASLSACSSSPPTTPASPSDRQRPALLNYLAACMSLRLSVAVCTRGRQGASVSRGTLCLRLDTLC